MVQNRAGVVGGRHVSRGFTLVELMIVVSIISVLAGLAIYGVRKYIESAKSHEATNMIKDIKEGQESYRRETDQYLSVSDNITDYYPSRPPWAAKIAWGGADATLARWSLLNVNPDAPVYFSYATTARAGGVGLENPWSDVNPARPSPWPANPTSDWYVVKAIADLNDDGKKSGFVGSSFTSEIWIENEGE
jgi:prepilin-type N-terminal cleavage/methylation domain-containing protein